MFLPSADECLMCILSICECLPVHTQTHARTQTRMCVHIYLSIMCMSDARGGQKVVSDLLDSCGLKTGPREEQLVLLTTEPSFQPLIPMKGFNQGDDATGWESKTVECWAHAHE